MPRLPVDRLAASRLLRAWALGAWLLPAFAAAQPAPVSVAAPWARASPGQVTTGAAYMTLTSHGAPDRLVGATTPVAAMAEVHETIADQGVMRMRPVDGLALDPETPVTLKPGGYHLMLMGLRHGLAAGDSFPVTLSFAHAPPMTVTVRVAPPGAMGPPAP